MTEYINRDAVHDLVRSLTKYAWASPVRNEQRVTVDADDVQFGVDKIPSADVAPVQHAKWSVNVGMNFFKERNCPVCKKRIESNFWNYCPNCGCMMDLEEAQNGK